MNLPEGTYLAYYKLRPDEPRVTAEYTVMAKVPRDGVAWEFIVQELCMGARIAHPDGEPFIKLNIYSDAYAAIQAMPEFFAELTALSPHTMPEVLAILDRLGATDETPAT